MQDVTQIANRTGTTGVLATLAAPLKSGAGSSRRWRSQGDGRHAAGGYHDILGSFIADIDAASQQRHAAALDGMKKSMERAVAHLGFKHFTYHIAHATGIQATTDRLPHILSTYPKPWVQHYFQEGYLNDDPVVSELLRCQGPFIWSDIALPDDLSRRQKRLFDEARDAGIADGITIPIRSRESEIAALSLVPDGQGRSAGTTARKYQHLLFLIAQHFHAHARRALWETSCGAGTARRNRLLSVRQLQVLDWIAKGKTNWEISAILEISPKSVEFHIECAKRQLQVFNRTHAVAKAIMLGMLPLRDNAASAHPPGGAPRGPSIPAAVPPCSFAGDEDCDHSCTDFGDAAAVEA